MSSPLSTHVLDTVDGLPAVDLQVSLEQKTGEQWVPHTVSRTDADGRVTSLLAPGALTCGDWRLTFETGQYYSRKNGTACFYPHVQIVFAVTDPTRHHHVPLLLAPHGYTTYRGS